MTPLERRLLLEEASNPDPRATLQRIFLIWTLKEAYTKAIGFGLGFDFKRIEYDTETNRFTVDGEYPQGWEFKTFSLGLGGDLYQVSVARFVGQENGEGARVDNLGLVNDGEWLTRYDAATVIKRVAGEK